MAVGNAAGWHSGGYRPPAISPLAPKTEPATISAKPATAMLEPPTVQPVSTKAAPEIALYGELADLADVQSALEFSVDWHPYEAPIANIQTILSGENP